MWQMSNRENSPHSRELPETSGVPHIYSVTMGGFLAAVKLDQEEWNTSKLANCRSGLESSDQMGMFLVFSHKDTS